MQCRFSFKHMETSESLSNYANEKIISKIERFSTKPIEAHVTFEVEGHMHHTHVNVHGGDGFNFQVDATSPDMYASVDLVIDKLEAQLKRRKERLKKHKNNHNVKFMAPQEPLDKEDCDNVPVDAADLLKYEKARARASG